MEHIIRFLREYPQLLVFIALAGGYFIGKIKIRGFNIGATAGVLIVALLLGQIGVTIPVLLKTVSFALFIFCIGYKVGPEFFGSLKSEGIKYILLTLVVAIVGLFTAILLGKIFHFDQGTTAGLLGGAMTQSSVIGTADGAIAHLAITAANKLNMENNVAITYAITYIFGTVGVILFFKLAPKFIRVNLRAEAIKLEEKLTGGDEEQSPEFFSWNSRINLRTFVVTNSTIFHKTVRQIEALFPGKVVIDRVKRADKIFEPNASMSLFDGDIVALLGMHDEFIDATKMLGKEVYDADLLNINGEILEICVLNKNVVGKTLGEISEKFAHRCFLRRIRRQGHALPIAKNTKIKKCDVLQVTGAKEDVEKLVRFLGYPERPTAITDLIMIGIGCFLGTLLGLLAVPVFAIPVTLGIGGGVLVSGLIFGWLRAIHPTFGQIPTPAQWLLTDLGLNLFIACVGLIAGPKALGAIQSAGVSIFIAGIFMSLIPMFVGLFFGKFLLKLNPVLLLGALTGAGTITAALNTLKEEAGNDTPALGYTIPYAFANVLLTIWGTLIVYLMYIFN